MLILKKGFPKPGDIVACTVSRISSFAAFVSLDEYEDREGMIHVSEISSKWIKNIRDYIKEGRRIVCKVLSVDETKDHINLSLRRVTSGQQKAKLEEVSRKQKAEKLLELVAKSFNMDLFQAYEKVGKTLESHFGELYFAFEEASLEGEKAFRKIRIPKDWKKAIAEIAKKNVVPPKVSIKGTLILTSMEPDGLLTIKKALIAAKNIKPTDKNVVIDVKTISPPKYSISITAMDYKAAEKNLKMAADCALKIMKKENGKGEFIR